jgi:acetyl-CoA C-acetyltransferase
VVIAARRTPIGRTGTPLTGVDLVGLLAPVLGALVDDLSPRAPGVDNVVMGNCTGPGGNPRARLPGLLQYVPGPR